MPLHRKSDGTIAIRHMTFIGTFGQHLYLQVEGVISREPRHGGADDGEGDDEPTVSGPTCSSNTALQCIIPAKRKKLQMVYEASVACDATAVKKWQLTVEPALI